MKLYYGVIKTNGIKMLQVSEDRDCLNCEILAGTFGHILPNDSKEAATLIFDLANEFNANAIEIDTVNQYKYIEVKR